MAHLQSVALDTRENGIDEPMFNDDPAAKP